VLGSHEVDVVAALRLKLDGELGDGLAGELSAALALADVPVLTEDAAQIAQAEEDGSAALPAAQAVLLTEVREGGAHDGVAAGVADAPLILQAVDAAIARTSAAVPELGQSRLDLLGEAALPRGREVDRLEVLDEEARVRAW
jgi:hypothetical protein